MAVNWRGSMSGALLMAMRALVLAGFPTTSTFTSRDAAALMALPCGVKIAPLALEQVGPLHPALRGMAPTSRAASASAKAVIGSSVLTIPCEQREGAVLELHRHALERTQGGGDLQHLQDHRLVGSVDLPGGDPEEEAVSDLTGGAGHCNTLGRSHEPRVVRLRGAGSVPQKRLEGRLSTRDGVANVRRNG
jgi:hypothetical protein